MVWTGAHASPHQCKSLPAGSRWLRPKTLLEAHAGSVGARYLVKKEDVGSPTTLGGAMGSAWPTEGSMELRSLGLGLGSYPLLYLGSIFNNHPEQL